MWSKTIIAAAIPLVLAAPAPLPHPVAAPAPAPIPIPQGTETTPVVGLLGSLLQGTLSLGSLTNAVPAVINDLGNFLDAAGPIGRKFSSSSLLKSYVDKIPEAISNGTVLGTDVPAIVQKLFQATKPTATPSSYQDIMTRAASSWGINSLSNIPSTQPIPNQNVLENIGSLILNGITSDPLQALISGIVCG